MSDHTRDEIKELENRVASIEAQLNRYKGFVGGVIFVVSSVVTIIQWVAPWVGKKLGIS